VKSLRVRLGRALMAPLARTWSPVTTALVRQLTPVTFAPLRTAVPTTRVVTAVLVTALGYAAVHLPTQVVGPRQLVNNIVTMYTSSLRFLYLSFVPVGP